MRQITHDTDTELLAQRSRFVCAIGLSHDEPSAREFIATRRRLHPKATHHCTAYILGFRQHTQRSNDDGEPSGTAGSPMLEVLRHADLTNVVAVVTRYFGGTKLGTGGLARAYSGAVEAALNTVATVELIPAQLIRISVDYAFGGSLEADLRARGFIVNDTTYSTHIELDVSIANDAMTGFETWLNQRTAGAATHTHIGDTTIYNS